MSTSNLIKIEANKPIHALDIAKEHLNTSHGHTLIAFSMISLNNKELVTTVSFENESQLYHSANQMIKVLLVANEDKVMLRSYKDNDKYLSNYLGIALTSEIKLPLVPDDFTNGSKIILDIEKNINEQTWKFYRIYEPNPRILKIVLNTELSTTV